MKTKLAPRSPKLALAQLSALAGTLLLPACAAPDGTRIVESSPVASTDTVERASLASTNESVVSATSAASATAADPNGVCQIVVAPGGLDTNPGTLALPFATLERARAAVQAQVPAATGPIGVCLRAGRYELEQTFTLGPGDSGTAVAPVTYRSFPGERAVLSGGGRLATEWSAYTATIYKTRMTRAFNQLFVNGERATRARSPNGNGYFNLSPVSTPSQMATSFIYQPGSLPPGLGESDTEIVSLERWMSPRERVASTDATTVTTEGAPWNTVAYGSYYGTYGSDYAATDRYYVENSLAALDAPGEWYLDQAAQELYYWPHDVSEIATGKFEAPRLLELVRGGTYPTNAGFLRTQAESVPFCRHIGVYPRASDALSFGDKSFTVAAWLRLPTGAVDSSWVLTKGEPRGPQANGAPGAGYGLSASSTDTTVPVQLVLADGAHEVTASVGAQPRGQWIHVAFAVDRVAATIQAYVNGTLADTEDISALGSVASRLPLDVGAYTNAGCSSSTVGDLRVYSGALTSTEVVEALAGIGPTEGLALWLPFDGDFDDHSAKPSQTVPFFPPAFTAGALSGQAADFSTSYPSEVAGSVDYVGFSDLVFEQTDWVMPFTGYPGNTPLWTSPAAVYLHSRHATVSHNVFAHLGSHAIAGMLADSTIANNDISDVGADAIRIGQIDTSAPDQLTLAEFASNDKISGNKIHDIGLVDRDAYAISITQGENNVISRNVIENAPGYGIAEGSGPGSSLITLGSNRVALNRIDNVMQLVNDGSAIYLTGTQPGTVIERNVIHDVVVTPAHLFDYLIFGIYLDGTANSFTVENNLTYRVQGSGILLNAASAGNANNLVQNNIFANGIDAQIFLNYASADSFRRNIVYYAGEPSSALFAVSAGNAIGASDENLFFSPDAPAFASQLAAWEAFGFDAHSIVADPLFVDAASDDYTLQSSSPALAPASSGGIGFEPIDFTGLP